jgi:hypothetical protein
VFTARYALSPYIKQIRFVFIGLITMNYSSPPLYFGQYMMNVRLIVNDKLLQCLK